MDTADAIETAEIRSGLSTDALALLRLISKSDEHYLRRLEVAAGLDGKHMRRYTH